MTKAARFCQADVARAVAGAVAGARKGGPALGSVEIDPNGNIVIRFAGEASSAGRPNPWDKLFSKPAGQ